MREDFDFYLQNEISSILLELMSTVLLHFGILWRENSENKTNLTRTVESTSNRKKLDITKELVK